MNVEKCFYKSFATIRVGLSNNKHGVESAYISETVKILAHECITRGVNKIAVQFYPQSYQHGWPIGFTVLLTDHLKKRDIHVVIIEAEPSLREMWKPLISSLGITVHSFLNDMCERRIPS